MSQQLISHSPDLKQLSDEGYIIEVKCGHLLVKDVPYINSNRELKHGILVTPLDLAGDVTCRPANHQAWFIGDHPCFANGTPIAAIVHGSAIQQLADEITVNHSFSAKPKDGMYRDYHHKMVTYFAIISAPTRSLNPSITTEATP